VGDPSTPNGVGWTTRFPKLSNQQWENTVQQLLGLEQRTGFADDFTQEPLDKSYTSEAAAELTIGGDAWARYQTAAERVAELVVSDDARVERLSPTPTSSQSLAERAGAFIDSFGRRAYRRPLTDSEKQAYGDLFAEGPTLVGGDALRAGMRLVIEAMLQSPHFLYRVEAAAVAQGLDDRKAFLSGYEVATRLSYTLWDSMPSDELLDAAGSGELDSADGVARWAEQMLADARARQTVLAFHEQTFLVASYGTQAKDPALGVDAEALAPALREEARRFFDQVVLEEQGGIAQLLTEPLAFVNEATAPLYGLSDVTGAELQARELDPSERVGLLMQLGFLTKNATRNASDPVHRGLLVLRKILCDEPDPPPMAFDLPVVEPGQTTREAYEQATACGLSCHGSLINPPGFAFENFDALGRLRTTDNGKPVDTTGSLSIRVGYSSREKQETPASELTFEGPVELVTKLAEEPRVHECYARNWMQFVLGREADPVERGAWELLRGVSAESRSARELLLALDKLDTFRSRVSV
jgi:hypothetical protein